MLTAISRRSKPLLIGSLIVALFLWWQFSAPEKLQAPLERLEALIYDLRLNLTLPDAEVDPRIVIIDIDEKSLSEIGHWPWPRDTLAQLVDTLYESGVTVTGFDMVFAEEERNSINNVIEGLRREGGSEPQALIQSLQKREKAFDNNLRFAESLQDRDVVLGFVYDYRSGKPIGQLPEPPNITPHSETLNALSAASAANFTANVHTLQQATPFAGFFSLISDRDGIIRRAPMLTRIGNDIYPSLSLEILRVFQLIDEVEVSTATIGKRTVIETIRVGQTTIPTDSLGRTIVPYRGGWGSFNYISAADLLKGRADKAKLEGAIALVGATAHGLFDLRSTPVQSIYPGVEVHANLIAGALDNRFPSRPEWGTGVEYLITLALGLLAALLQPFLPPLRLIIGTLTVVATIIGINFWVWMESGFILSLALPLLMIFVVSTFNLAWGFLHESSARRDLKDKFGQYIPPELVQEMSDNPEAAYGFEGETREMTVMFSDIRSFTTISESLDASQLKKLLNRFFSPMTHIIFENRGTIDKYVGDMIMAFWGAPLHDEKHAIHAVEAALAMLRKTEELKLIFQHNKLPEVEIGIGINTGTMNVGDMGSEYRRAYTVLGDAVNQGSRLEALTKFYGVSLLIGEETFRQLDGAIPCREIDRVKVKGKREAVRIYEPLDAPSEEELEQMTSYHRALAYYHNLDWDRAAHAFARLNQTHPHTLYQLYLVRCRDFQASPPPNGWDGVYEHQQKSGGE